MEFLGNMIAREMPLVNLAMSRLLYQVLSLKKKGGRGESFFEGMMLISPLYCELLEGSL